MRKSQLAIGLTIFEILGNEKGIPKSMSSIIFELANRKVIEKEMSRRTFARYISDLNNYLPFNTRIEYVRARTNGYIIKDLDKKAISTEMGNKKLKDPVVKRALENALSSRTFSDVSQAQKLLQDNFNTDKHDFERFYSNELNSGLENSNIEKIRGAISERNIIDIEYIDTEGIHKLLNVVPLWIIHKPSSLTFYYHEENGNTKSINHMDLRYFTGIEIKENNKGAWFDFENIDQYINDFGELKSEFKPMQIIVPEERFESFYKILMKIDFPQFFSIETENNNKLLKFKHISKIDREDILELAKAFGGNLK